MTGAPIAAFVVMAVAALILGLVLVRTGRGGRHRDATGQPAVPQRGRHRS